MAVFPFFAAATPTRVVTAELIFDGAHDLLFPFNFGAFFCQILTWGCCLRHCLDPENTVGY